MALSTTHSALPRTAEMAEIDSPPAGEASMSLATIQSLLTDALPEGRLAIYEAGGGSTSYLPRSVRERSRMSVVDIDAVQLANNTYADEAILGDIQTHRFPDGSFDLIACYNVIEHLPRADLALENFASAVRTGGLIFIGAPNPRSLSGAITKFTPHAFHIWFYRAILGRANAGLPGEPPFPTYFHRVVSRARLQAFFASRGFEILYERAYESPRYSELRESRPTLARVLDGFTRALNALSANTINVRHGDYHLLVRKR